MFEYKLALKYLIPTRKSLSTSLIALISLGVISMVVWLSLVFLSVTAGIEQNWLKKLTSVHAPLRIYPTKEYYKRYNSSEGSPSTIDEKRQKFAENPSLKDPLKDLYSHLENLSQKESIPFQDYESAPSLMRLSLQREQKSSQLSQMSYIFSFPEKNPHLKDLIVPPTEEDLMHLMKTLSSSEEIDRFFAHVVWKKAFLRPQKKLSIFLLPKGRYSCFAEIENSQVRSLSMDQNVQGSLQGSLVIEEKNAYFSSKNTTFPLNKRAFFTFHFPKEGSLKVDRFSVEKAKNIADVEWIFQFRHLGKLISFRTFFKDLFLKEAFAKRHFQEKPELEPLWPYFHAKKWHLPKRSFESVILPKSYQKSQVKIGDFGHFAFMGSVLNAPQEMQLPFYVAGFYDPGILPLGHKSAFASKNMTQTILGSSHMLSLDQEMQNGIFIWSSIHLAKPLKELLERDFEKTGLSTYWKVESFQDYPFAKDLMKQFQSDRTLFVLIALIMIIVACSNIISMLIVLVKDKKREIAILSALGASRKSIALIFGLIGIFLGSLGSFLGCLAAIITLRYLDVVVSFLSWLQGHQAFQAAFFGDSLPNAFSQEAFFFVIIATPIVSLIAGLIPAIKASKIHPTDVLRS